MIENILFTPVILGKLLLMKKDIYVKVGELRAEAYMSDEPLPKEKWDKVNFLPFKKGGYWAKKKFACCLFRFEGNIPSEAKGKKTVALLKLGAEGEVYRDGQPVCGVTPIMATIDVGQPVLGKQVVPLSDSPEGGEKISLTVDCGHNGYCGVFLYNPRLVKADIAVVDEEKKDYYYDCLALLLTLATSEDNPFLTDDGVNEIKSAFNESYALYKEGKITEARKKLSPFFDEKQTSGVEYTAIGHGHLDLAWKWPARESKRKAVRTFSNVINFLEKYDFVFGASQAQMFQWVEESEPELFEKIKENVEKGKIELQGGMWTECDCNMPCGESLIRQFLYGDEYFLSRFGKSSDVVWLPDVFGFPATLPQIIRGVGKKYFMTIKLNWNEYNKFPLQSFEWVGPDGSSVISHIAPEGTYACSASPVAFVKADVKNVQKDTGAALLIYGISDGGGGPGEGHLEMLKRAGGKFLPKARAGSSESFFAKLDKVNLPRYTGELYLEKHQGTLTSQAKNKYYNRLAERKLHNLEWLESVTGRKYAQKDEMWKRVLFNQFHDILPGSGIGRVHLESVEDYASVCENIDKETEALIQSMSKGKALCALNPSPFGVKEKILLGEELYEADCKPYSSCRLVPCGPVVLDVGENYIENGYIKVAFDNETGKIISLYDKTMKREYAKNGAFHALTVYTDPKGKYDAWDINRKYLTLPKKNPTLVKISFAQTPNRATAYLSYWDDKSLITQEIYVKDSKTLYFDTQVEWNESHKMLRADFEPSVWSGKADFDIQFGSADRSTKSETSEEKAMYEVCGHKYAAVGDGNQGFVAVMSRCKFGYRVKDGVISLNLLRSPSFPDRNCDKGTQSFDYAFTIEDSAEGVVKTAYNYDNPLIVTEENVSIDMEFGVRGDGIITETIKLAERTEGTVVRAYERFGKKSEGKFVMPEGYVVYETDMSEKIIKEASDAGFGPHEIKTFMFVKGSREQNQNT